MDSEAAAESGMPQGLPQTISDEEVVLPIKLSENGKSPNCRDSPINRTFS
jgi:hypothetical protein